MNISKATRDENLMQRVQEISGQSFQKCYQCGTCSGSCPMYDDMSIYPRQIMAFLQLGNREALEKSNTQWICASCYVCVVRCPRGIDIARVMEALRQLTLRQNINRVEPSRIDKDKIQDLPQIAMVSGFRKLTS